MGVPSFKSTGAFIVAGGMKRRPEDQASKGGGK